MKWILQVVVGVIASVLASLAVVWLLSQLIGFRFRPELVAALSGSLSVVVMIAERRGKSFA